MKEHLTLIRTAHMSPIQLTLLIMRLSELLSLAQSFPTIMNIEQEIFLIDSLKKIDVNEFKHDPNAFLALLAKIQDAHNDNGIFDVTPKNESTFVEYVKWLATTENATGIKINPYSDGLGMTANDIADAMSKSRS